MIFKKQQQTLLINKLTWIFANPLVINWEKLQKSIKNCHLSATYWFVMKTTKRCAKKSVFETSWSVILNELQVCAVRMRSGAPVDRHCIVCSNNVVNFVGRKKSRHGRESQVKPMMWHAHDNQQTFHDRSNAFSTVKMSANNADEVRFVFCPSSLPHRQRDVFDISHFFTYPNWGGLLSFHWGTRWMIVCFGFGFVEFVKMDYPQCGCTLHCVFVTILNDARDICRTMR